jgi:hypothetical protein
MPHRSAWIEHRPTASILTDNDEALMTKSEARILKSRGLSNFGSFGFRGSSFVRHCCFVIRHSLTLTFTVPLLSTAKAQVDISKLPPPSTNQVDFIRDIKPIFERSCLRCHGPERPKSKYRLDTRESALKGGEENTDDIVPGRSAESRLIHYVARLVPDLEMPPKGKGDPLTTAEISLLRAWIDQGAIWEPMTSSGPQVVVAPTVGGVVVSGERHMFREHFWTREDWNPGFEEFSITDLLGKDGKATLTGHALRDDYRVSLNLEHQDIGFARFGAERYRKYFDDSGGYFPKFFPSIFSLDRDLHLDQGKAWIDFGLTLPNWPKLIVGYEYQFRQGEKSTLQWGLANRGDYSRNIYPASKTIDERVHIVKFDAEHDFAGVHFDDSFRGEFYDLKTRRQNTRFYLIDDPTVHFRDDVKERYKYFQGANALRVEKAFTDWFLGAGGYLYSKLNADASFSLDPLVPLGMPISGDRWESHEIVLERETHAFNVTALLGPWEGLSLSAGVLNEWTHQEGFGNADKDFIPGTTNFVAFDANQDKAMIEESVALRYTTIPFTTLFAEARLQQESVGEFEQEIGSPADFLRDTDADSERSDWRVGFNTSPWKRVSFNAHYRRSDKQIDYDHRRDQSTNQPISGNGYPAFIRDRDIDTDEIDSRLVVQPLPWLKTTFGYKYQTTRYETTTDAATLSNPGDITSGGRAPPANYRAHLYTFNATLTPWQRWYLSGTFSYQLSSIAAFANEVPQVVPYHGGVYSVVASATFLIDQKTDFQVTYGLSRADYAQDNFDEGLPVGMKYTRHAVTAGITRRLINFLSARIQYGFYNYSEPSAGGANNYSAHAIFGTLVLHLK